MFFFRWRIYPFNHNNHKGERSWKGSVMSVRMEHDVWDAVGGETETTIAGEGTRNCPCYRLKADIHGYFPVLSFPDVGLFMCPLNTLSRILSWYRAFHRDLARFREQRTPFFSPGNVARFPASFPQNELLSDTVWDRLESRHKSICHVTQKAALIHKTLGESGRLIVNANLDRAMAAIDRNLADIRQILSRREAEAALTDEDQRERAIKELSRSNQAWLAWFESLFLRMADHGAPGSDDIVRIGDFRVTGLGRSLYAEGGLLKAFQRLPEVAELKAANQSVHGLAAVATAKAATLRFRGMNSGERRRHQRLIADALGRVRAESGRLESLIAPAVQTAMDARTGVCPFLAEESGNAPSLVDVLAEIASWEGIIIRSVERGPSPQVEESLPHTRGAVAGLLETAMTDPGRAGLYNVPLRKIYLDHFHLHAAAAGIVALAENGYGDEARASLPRLNRQSHNLAQEMTAFSHVLGLH